MQKDSDTVGLAPSPSGTSHFLLCTVPTTEHIPFRIRAISPIKHFIIIMRFWPIWIVEKIMWVFFLSELQTKQHDRILQSREPIKLNGFKTNPLSRGPTFKSHTRGRQMHARENEWSVCRWWAWNMIQTKTGRQFMNLLWSTKIN